jgi:hypothetical protein
MNTTTTIDEDAMLRVKATCREKLPTNPDILGVVELLYDKIERPGYWERAFIVAWKDHFQSGTHRVVINENEGECMWGHYFIYDDGTDAIEDMRDRAGGTI